MTPAGPAGPATRVRRSPLALSVAAGLAGGALVLLGAGRPWEVAGGSAAVVAGDDVNPVGSLVSSLGAVVLLGSVVVVVTRSLGRRLAGALVVLAAVATLYVAATASGAWWPWRSVVLAGAVLGAAGGALAGAHGHRWTAMSSRYDAPTAPRPEHESDPWRALDRGEDPTL